MSKPWSDVWREARRYLCIWLIIYLAAIAGALHAPLIARWITGW